MSKPYRSAFVRTLGALGASPMPSGKLVFSAGKYDALASDTHTSHIDTNVAGDASRPKWQKFGNCSSLCPPPLARVTSTSTPPVLSVDSGVVARMTGGAPCALNRSVSPAGADDDASVVAPTETTPGVRAGVINSKPYPPCPPRARTATGYTVPKDAATPAGEAPAPQVSAPESTSVVRVPPAAGPAGGSTATGVGTEMYSNTAYRALGAN